MFGHEEVPDYAGSQMCPAFNVEHLAEVTSELGPDERLVWNDRPVPLAFAVARWKGGLKFLGAILTAQILHLWFTNGLQSALECMKILSSWLTIVSLIGIALTGIWRYFEALELTYFISDRRVGKIWSGQLPQVWSWTPNELSSIRREKMTSKLGNVIFDRKLMMGSEGGQTIEEDGFFGIKNSQEVAQYLLNLKYELGQDDRKHLKPSGSQP